MAKNTFLNINLTVLLWASLTYFPYFLCMVYYDQILLIIVDKLWRNRDPRLLMILLIQDGVLWCVKVFWWGMLNIKQNIVTSRFFTGISIRYCCPSLQKPDQQTNSIELVDKNWTVSANIIPIGPFWKGINYYGQLWTIQTVLKHNDIYWTNWNNFGPLRTI